MFQTFSSKLSLLAIGLFAFSLVGCGDPPKPPSGTLIGTVKSGGELCGNCMISIYDSSSLVTKGGFVDESGAYELKEVPFGDYKARIVRMPTNLDTEVIDDRIPPKYKSVDTSGLSVSVTVSEPPVTLDIDME